MSLPAPTRGVQIAFEKRCKICSSPHRAEIEDLLAIRSDKGSLVIDGEEVRITEDFIFAVAQERWSMKLNRNNIGTHFGKHFKKGNPGDLADQQSAARNTGLELVKKMERGEIERIDADAFLDTVIAVGLEKIQLDPNSVTVDHALKAVAEKTKRKHDEARDKLMVTLGGGIAAAAGAAYEVAKRLPDNGPETVEVTYAEVVDAVEAT